MIKKKKRLLNTILGRVVYFFLTWLFTGFALGSFILLILVRNWTQFVRKNGYSGSVESSGVIILIIILIALSLYISRKLYHWHKRRRTAVVTFFALFIPFLFALSALIMFMHPRFLNGPNESSLVSARFTIGAYPSEDDMIELKRQNYTAIISLLHPAVVPFEPSLMRAERMDAKNAGLQLIEAPMLPWVSNNQASLNKIQEIIMSGKGRYYIHCYLGKDRVNFVKNFILKLNNDATMVIGEAESQRTFESMRKFERGDIYKLENQVYLTPFPTHEELLAFFLAGNIKTVVNLTDTSNKGIRQYNNEERESFNKTGITVKYLPLKNNISDALLNRYIDSIRSYAKPLVIHFWETRSARNIQFKKMYAKKSGVTPLNLATNATENY
ncbi:MAG: hypothetical protein JWN76_2435 [Chitinophagaceae bacterium]|nr:hypothetical protein [Chitinophagaceae bacterium]